MTRKRFGQHFLHDPAIIDRLVSIIDPKPGESLVEIGPGEGALTTPLLERAGELDAIEVDRDLVAELRTRFHGAGALRLHSADALRFDYESLETPGPLRLVGNLPYNISSPLLFRLLALNRPVRDMHFMLQREVVHRIVAPPGSPDYGRLSVAVAARAEAESVLHAGRGAFKPPPQVASAVVRIRPRIAPFEIADREVFDRVVTQAFSRRRKTLRNALRGLLDERDIDAAGVDASLRPERLSPADFAALANRMAGRNQ